MHYADKIKELESFVSKLEEGSCSLEEALSVYQRGQALSQECLEILQKAQQTIQTATLPAQESDGSCVTEGL